MTSYSPLGPREGKQDWEIKSDDLSDSGNGPGFVAGSTSVLSSVTGGTRYKAVVTGAEGYDEVGHRRDTLESPSSKTSQQAYLQRYVVHKLAATSQQPVHLRTRCSVRAR